MFLPLFRNGLFFVFLMTVISIKNTNKFSLNFNFSIILEDLSNILPF